MVDNLTYNYTIPNTTNTSNRLLSVTDGSSNATGVKDGTSNFSYDGNGNMTADGSKNATIAYNLLNLPRQVTISGSANTVQYIYDGAGTKLQMTAPGANTLYAGAFEYSSDGTLLRVGLEEGQLVRNGSGTYEVNYYLRDHLGNVRMVLKEDGTVLQETEYYAFGLPVSKAGNDASNKYLYNGKEKQPETGWLDYGARMYMAELGRWGVVDPMAEKYYSYSPFVYSINDPVLLNDPDGRDIDVSRFKSKDEQAILKQFLSTKVGYAFFAQFANKGDKIGGITFKVAGERSNDLLTLQSTDHVNMVTDNGQTSTYEKKNPSDNQDRPGSIYGKSLQNADKDTDVGKGVIHLIRINQEQGGVSKLNTLSHEAFVHVQEDINRLRALQSNKAIKPGTAEYIKQLQYTGTSSVVDHAKLGQGKVQGYQNISAQLDKLNGTKVFIELYKRDVNNQKGK